MSDSLKNWYPSIGAVVGAILFFIAGNLGIIKSHGGYLAYISGWSWNNPYVQLGVFVIIGVCIGWWVSKRGGV